MVSEGAAAVLVLVTHPPTPDPVSNAGAWFALQTMDDLLQAWDEGGRLLDPDKVAVIVVPKLLAVLGILPPVNIPLWRESR